MLNASSPPPVLLARCPTWGRIFHSRLAVAGPDINIISTDFDVKDDEYPSSLYYFDAIMLSGGGAEDAVYNDVPWARKLATFIRDVFENYPHVKIFGTCFGHGMVCQSLLGRYGVRVEPNPAGVEIGVKDIALNESFLASFGKPHRRDNVLPRGGLKATVKLQLIHGDHLVIPEGTELLQGWKMVGATEQCKVQGMFLAGRVFTLQGHFEFDREINSEVVKHDVGSSWEPKRLQKVLDDIDADDDADVAARMILGFLLGDEI